MRIGALLLLAFLLPSCPLPAAETVRVRVFRKLRLTRVVLALRGGGWRLGGSPIPSGRYRIALLSGGRVRISGRNIRRIAARFQFRDGSSRPLFRIRARGISRLYRGDLDVSAFAAGILLVNRVGFERYVASVLFGEIPSLAGRRRILQALKAQAVAVRSYARYYMQSGKRRHAGEGYDFCDLTHCQVYKGVVPSGFRVILRAVRETQGVVLRYRGRLVPGFYSSTCGGRTVSPGEVWGKSPLKEAFQGKRHRLHGRAPCRTSIHFRWVYSISRMRFRDFFTGCCFPLLSIRDLQAVYGKGGSLRFLKTGYNRIPGYRFRNQFCRKFGWNSLRSLCFTFKLQGGRVVFQGSGLGHRIGLCQHGAFALSAAGWSWRGILREYYPGMGIGR